MNESSIEFYLGMILEMSPLRYRYVSMDQSGIKLFENKPSLERYRWIPKRNEVPLQVCDMQDDWLPFAAPGQTGITPHLLSEQDIIGSLRSLETLQNNRVSVSGIYHRAPCLKQLRNKARRATRKMVPFTLVGLSRYRRSSIPKQIAPQYRVNTRRPDQPRHYNQNEQRADVDDERTDRWSMIDV